MHPRSTATAFSACFHNHANPYLIISSPISCSVAPIPPSYSNPPPPPPPSSIPASKSSIHSSSAPLPPPLDLPIYKKTSSPPASSPSRTNDLHILKLQGNWREAIQSLFQLANPSVSDWNTTMLTCYEAMQFQYVLALFEKLTSNYPQNQIHNAELHKGSTVSTQADIKQSAISTSSYISPNKLTFILAIKAAIHCDKMTNAWKLLLQMRSLPKRASQNAHAFYPPPEIYLAFFRAYARNPNYVACSNLVQLMIHDQQIHQPKITTKSQTESPSIHDDQDKNISLHHDRHEWDNQHNVVRVKSQQQRDLDHDDHLYIAETHDATSGLYRPPQLTREMYNLWIRSTRAPGVTQQAYTSTDQHADHAIHKHLEQNASHRTDTELDMKNANQHQEINTPNNVPDLDKSNNVADLLVEQKQKLIGDRVLYILRHMESTHVAPDISTYNEFLYVCAWTSNWKLAFSLLHSMKHQLNILPNIRSYVITMGACYRCEKPDLVIKIFQEMIQHRLLEKFVIDPSRADFKYPPQQVEWKHKVFRMVLEAASPARDFNAIEQVIALDQDNHALAVADYNLALKILASASKLNELMNIFSKMKDHGVSPDHATFILLIEAFALAGRLKMTKQLVDEMKTSGFPHNLQTYTALITAYGKSRMPIYAYRSLNNMKLENLYPDLECYNACLKALAYNSQCDLLEDTFQQMLAEHVQPDLESYVHIIYAFRRSQMHMEVVQKFDTMIASTVRPDLRIFVAVLHACDHACLGAQAKRVFNSMARFDVQPSALCYEMVIRACAKSDHLDAAMYFFDILLSLDKKPIRSTFIILLNTCSKKGRWKQAVKVQQAMKNNGIALIAASYTSILNACARSGAWKESLQLFKEMMSDGIKVDEIAYGACMNALQKGHQWQKMLTLLTQMRTSGLQPNIICYSSCISACAKAGEIHTVFELLEKLRNDGLKPDLICYSSVLHACACHGDWEKCRELLGEMTMNGVRPDLIAYNICIRACENNGEWREALGLLREMLQNGIEPDQITLTTYMNVCANIAADTPETAAEAVESFEGLIGAGITADEPAYNACAMSYQKIGRWDLAIETLRKMETKGVTPTGSTYGIVIKACTLKGQMRKAQVLLKEMQRKGMQLDNMTFNSCFIEETVESPP